MSSGKLSNVLMSGVIYITTIVVVFLIGVLNFSKNRFKTSFNKDT